MHQEIFNSIKNNPSTSKLKELILDYNINIKDNGIKRITYTEHIKEEINETSDLTMEICNSRSDVFIMEHIKSINVHVLTHTTRLKYSNS